MTQVDGLGTRRAFPDYIARRPALALEACRHLGEVIRHYAEEDRELPFDIPPFSVLMYIEMLGMLRELAPDGVLLAVHIPAQVKKWMDQA